MEIAKKISKQLYYHSFVRYIVIGGSTVAIDFFLLVLLHGVLNVNLFIATTISYWVSIAFNFTANRIWTFGARESNVIKHIGAYAALLGFNYLFTIVFIGVATDLGMHYTIAKILAIPIQITWTYFAYKRFVFR